MKKLLVSITALLPTTVFAHPGHIANDAAHGSLHVEHIIIIAAISLLVYTIITLRSK